MTITVEDCVFCKLLTDFRANPRWIAAFEHSVAFVAGPQVFMGRTVLITRNHYEDMLAIPEAEFDGINRELRILAKGIETAFAADRMNFANFGNVVAHQHWHIWPRRSGDLNWGGPPIPAPDEDRLSDAAYRDIADRIRAAL